MFSVDWSNQATLLLNLTNLGLGVVLVLSLSAVFLGLCSDWLAEFRHTKGQRQQKASRGSDRGRMPAEGGLTRA